MERWSGCVALVTGGSIGIGASIVRRLASHGLKVVVCARRIELVQDISEDDVGASGEFCPVKCDVRCESDILDLFQFIRDKYGRLDICLCNAGLARQNTLAQGVTEHWREMLDVNVLGTCICTREAVKLMKETGIDDGHIIHMNGLLGHRVMSSQMTFYAATKHAIRALTEGLRRELVEAKSSIRVSSVSPAFVETDFHQRSLAHKPEDKSSDFVFPCKKILQADDIAEAVVYILSAKPHVQVNDIIMRPVGQLN